MLKTHIDRSKYENIGWNTTTYDVICQFCTVKGMVVESEVLKAQSCALSKLSLPMHSNEFQNEMFLITQKDDEIEKLLHSPYNLWFCNYNSNFIDFFRSLRGRTYWTTFTKKIDWQELSDTPVSTVSLSWSQIANLNQAIDEDTSYGSFLFPHH